MDLFTGIGTQFQHRKWIYGLSLGLGTRTTFFSSKVYPELDVFVAYDLSRKKQKIYMQPMLCAKYSLMKLIKNNYKLLNDTKNYRILRLCIDNDIGIRKLINNRDIKEVNKDSIYLLPENMMFDNFNLQHSF